MGWTRQRLDFFNLYGPLLERFNREPGRALKTTVSSAANTVPYIQVFCGLSGSSSIEVVRFHKHQLCATGTFMFPLLPMLLLLPKELMQSGRCYQETVAEKQLGLYRGEEEEQLGRAYLTGLVPTHRRIIGASSFSNIESRRRTGRPIRALKDQTKAAMLTGKPSCCMAKRVTDKMEDSARSRFPALEVTAAASACLETYWQSDGPQPHLVNVHFRRKTTIQGICIYADYKLDESYTPNRMSVRVGSSFHDLQELEAVDLREPTGWVHIATRDAAGNPVRTFLVETAVLSNHQNGRDTHLRQIKVHSPVP
ncbi:hypothetical protein HPB50_011021 [Hyalomma asiaticum]|uniref:Uncharacterized protein n=1 Tax=Hyalomma asiaticum TaxID=266040 RepID=A0ACB7TIF5_HYAAI|nr:hypothetical protein HPB50_011021 [Hyalomma asiaticum]